MINCNCRSCDQTNKNLYVLHCNNKNIILLNNNIHHIMIHKILLTYSTTPSFLYVKKFQKGTMSSLIFQKKIQIFFPLISALAPKKWPHQLGQKVTVSTSDKQLGSTNLAFCITLAQKRAPKNPFYICPYSTIFMGILGLLLAPVGTLNVYCP